MRSEDGAHVGVSFDALQADHQAVLDALGRLEASVAAPGSGEGQAAAILSALDSFLEFQETRIDPHMRAEEEQVYPLLSHYLPPEVGSAEVLLREHETARGLAVLLRRARTLLRRAVPDAESQAASLVKDLSLLLRQHIRKEDEVINPLLRRLLEKDSTDSRNRKAI